MQKRSSFLHTEFLEPHPSILGHPYLACINSLSHWFFWILVIGLFSCFTGVMRSSPILDGSAIYRALKGNKVGDFKCWNQSRIVYCWSFAMSLVFCFVTIVIHFQACSMISCKSGGRHFILCHLDRSCNSECIIFFYLYRPPIINPLSLLEVCYWNGGQGHG